MSNGSRKTSKKAINSLGMKLRNITKNQIAGLSSMERSSMSQHI